MRERARVAARAARDYDARIMRALVLCTLLVSGCFSHYLGSARALKEAEASGLPRDRVAVGALRLPSRLQVWLRADRAVVRGHAPTGTVGLRGFNRTLTIGAALLLASVVYGVAALSAGLVDVNSNCTSDGPCSVLDYNLGIAFGIVAGVHLVAGVVVTTLGSSSPSQEVPAGRPGVQYLPYAPLLRF
jgi:hypothetical protein